MKIFFRIMFFEFYFFQMKSIIKVLAKWHLALTFHPIVNLNKLFNKHYLIIFPLFQKETLIHWYYGDS